MPLWAAMVYCGFALLLPRCCVWLLATAAATFALGIELSQLSEHPLLELARATRLGALVLGHGFLWIDLVRYLAGIVLAAGVGSRGRTTQEVRLASGQCSPSPVPNDFR